MKKQEARGGRWEEGNNRTLCFLFPLPIVPCAFFSLSPSLPTTKRGLYEGESPHRLSHRGLYSSCVSVASVAVVGPGLQKTIKLGLTLGEDKF